MSTEESVIQDEMWLRDVETIKVFADRRRLAILRLLEEPRTVKAVAEALGTAASKLYYHVNLLEKHGLVQVVDRRIEGNLVEKVYQAAARRFKLVNPILNRDLPHDSAVELIADSLQETQRDFLEAYARRDGEAHPPRYPFFSQKRVRLSPTQLTALHGRLSALIEEVAQLGAENAAGTEALYELSLLFFKREEKHP